MWGAGLLLMMVLQSCQGLQGVARYKAPDRTGSAPAASAKESTPVTPTPAPAPSTPAAPSRFSPSNHPVSVDKLMAFVADWKGTPYRYGGLSRSGIDCSGFTSTLYKDVYQTTIPRTSLDQFQVGTPVSPSDLQPGDLVFFQLKQTRTVSHVGVFLGNGDFAHASLSAGVTIDKLTDPYYADTYKGARRVK